MKFNISFIVKSKHQKVDTIVVGLSGYYLSYLTHNHQEPPPLIQSSLSLNNVMLSYTMSILEYQKVKTSPRKIHC